MTLAFVCCNDCTLFFSLDVMTSSLVPVKPWDDSLTVRSTMEVEEFSQSFPEAAHPHTAYVNNLYVYPLSLNYSNQKVFSKVKKKKEEEENCISVGWSQNKCSKMSFFLSLSRPETSL